MAKIDAEIFERYASEAAFLWSLRNAATRDARYDLRDLCELDERLEAQLDGLRLAGDEGWEICAESLEDGKTGEVFAAIWLAITQHNLPRIAGVLDAGGNDPSRARGIVAALAWAPLDEVKPFLGALLHPRCSPALHYLGIAAGAAHRVDLGAALKYAVSAKDVRLKARALRAVGETGRVDLLIALKDELDARDDGCRFSAAWSAALFGESTATSVLMELADEGGPFAARAIDMAMRRMDPAEATAWLRACPKENRRTALIGAAALGDPAIVTWLFDNMTEPEFARRALQTFALITGVDVATEKLKTRPPEGFRAGPTDDPNDDDVSMDPDVGLPWPDVNAVQAWWAERKSEYPEGTRLLLGKPMHDLEWLPRVLYAGTQPARASAALEISIRQSGTPVFEVRAAGSQQRKTLEGA